MSLANSARLATAAFVALGLAGCVDVDMDIALTSPTTARAVMTQEMGADFYAMVKMEAESGESEDGAFCEEGVLSENRDGSATCTIEEEGAFAALDLGQDEGGVTFTPAGAGLVRIAMPTSDMMSELGADESELDAQTRAMMEAFFVDRTITVSFSGAEIVETNMDISDDGKSAEKVLPIMDLVNGSADLPDELFAVVRAP
jgi:hypothetical protein